MTHYTLGIIRRKYQKHERSSGPSISKGSPGGMLKLLENASKDLYKIKRNTPSNITEVGWLEGKVG